MTASWPTDRPVPHRPVPRRPALGAHDFDPLSMFCRACAMPAREMAEAPGLQRWCTGARDGDWERRAAEDEPRREAARAAIDADFAAADQARDDAQTFTWGDIKRAFGIPPGQPLP